MQAKSKRYVWLARTCLGMQAGTTHETEQHSVPRAGKPMAKHSTCTLTGSFEGEARDMKQRQRPERRPTYGRPRRAQAALPPVLNHARLLLQPTARRQEGPCQHSGVVAQDVASTVFYKAPIGYSTQH